MLGDIRLAGEHRRRLDGARPGGAVPRAGARRLAQGPTGLSRRSTSRRPPTAASTCSARYGLGYDGSADRDGDGVPDVLELRAGSDPRSATPTATGLTDRFEILVAVLAHHPAKADTDGDGTSDAAEDLDVDGLSAAGEQLAGVEARSSPTPTATTSATERRCRRTGPSRRRPTPTVTASTTAPSYGPAPTRSTRTATTTASSTGPTRRRRPSREGDVSVARHRCRRSLRRASRSRAWPVTAAVRRPRPGGPGVRPLARRRRTTGLRERRDHDPLRRGARRRRRGRPAPLLARRGDGLLAARRGRCRR